VRSIGRLLEIVRLMTVNSEQYVAATLINMKIFKSLLSVLFLFCAGLLVSCGGGGGGGSSGGVSGGASITALTMTSSNTSNADFVALAPTTDVVHASLLDRFLNSLFPSAYAVLETTDAVTVTGDTVAPVFSTPLVIKNFSIPFSLKNAGHQYLTMSGEFAGLQTASGVTINCNLVISDYKADGATTCIYTLKSDEAATIPVAVIREGNIDGFYDAHDSVYFAVNKTIGGYTLYKYYEGQISSAKTSTTGQITNILSGEKSIFGYDASQGSGGPLLFGNVQRGLDVSTTPDRVMTYKQFVVFPRISTDAGIRSSFFTMNDATSTSYSADFSIDCDNPTSLDDTADHTYGSFWISTTDAKLCETFQVTNHVEPIAFRIVNTEGSWSAIKVSNNKILGIVTIGGQKRLILDTIAGAGSATQNLGTTRSIVTTQKLSSTFDLDDVTSISTYASGFIVKGVKNSTNTTRYYNTTTNAVVSFARAPVELKRKIATIH